MSEASLFFEGFAGPAAREVQAIKSLNKAIESMTEGIEEGQGTCDTPKAQQKFQSARGWLLNFKQILADLGLEGAELDSAADDIIAEIDSLLAGVCILPVSGYEVVTSPALAFGDTGYGGWSCPAGKVVIGGGFKATKPVAVSTAGTPGSVWPHYTFGPAESGWVVQDAPDGAGNTITIYAICAAPVPGYEVVSSSPLAFGDTGYGGWSCPAGKNVIGGGFKATKPVAVSTAGTPGSVWPHYTFGPAESGWVVQDAPDSSGNTITISAICADPVSGYEVVSSPALAFGDTGYGGWSCPAGKVVTGGGFKGTKPVAVSAPGTPGSVWPHYTFGPAEYGWVVQDAPDSSGNTIRIDAICANP
jgi:hypothetical protein